MRAVIVEDEPHSELMLKKLLSENHPQVKVVASGGNLAEGYQLIQHHEPELVFLDIELPDGLSFELLNRFNDLQFQIIFITAHNEYAVTAIKFGALDYLLKPIQKEELAKSLEKVQRQLKEKISADQVQILLETLRNLDHKKLPTRIALSTSEGILYKLVKDIIRLEAHQNYTEFSIANESKPVLTSQNIGEYVDQFERYHEFMKVHRSHLVNLLYVDKYVKADGGYLVMKDGARVNVSRAFRDDLLDRLNEL